MNKKDTILALFFNEPTKHWHFTEMCQEAGISKPQAARWLKILQQEDIIQKQSPPRKMPYYIAHHGSKVYQTKKRLFALEQLEQRGILSDLASLPYARTVILFGSMSRWDWYKESDVDLFVYGSDEGLDQEMIRRKVSRDVEIFLCRDWQELSLLNPSLLRNIKAGFVIKGSVSQLEVAG